VRGREGPRARAREGGEQSTSPEAEPESTWTPSRLTSSTVVQRVSSEAARLVSAGLRSPSSRVFVPPAPKPNPHAFTFDHSVRSGHECTPLLVFVNPASGGRQGQAALTQLRALLSEHQVVDLTLGQTNVDESLASFRTVGRFRVLVCGGDGTVGWVLSTLDRLRLDYTPPVAILPLGTGNDLARALGWGGGHRPGRNHVGDLISILSEVETAQVTLLDRWTVHFDDARVPRTLGLGGGRAPPQRTMQNYLGLGVDAKVALEWHRRRETDPHLFTSRLRNKLRYARYGARHLFRSDFSELCSQLVIEADGILLSLPPGTEGVIVLNIASYGGGSDLWGPEPVDDLSGGGATSFRSHRADSPPPEASTHHPDEPHRGFGDPLRQAADRYAAAALASSAPVGEAHSAPANDGDSAPSGDGGLAAIGDSARYAAVGLGDVDFGDGEGANIPDDGFTRCVDFEAAGALVRPWERAQCTGDIVHGHASRSTTSSLAVENRRTTCKSAGCGSPTGYDKLFPRAAAANHSAASGGSALNSGTSHGGGSHHASMSSRHSQRSSTDTIGESIWIPPSMADGLLEVVAIQNVLQLGLAQMSLTGATRIAQCSSLTITSISAMPMQVDGEPFELEPVFAPRQPMRITIQHKSQAVMLSRSRVRTDGVALEALDWAMEAGVITVEQHQTVLREVARRTGSLQQSKLRSNSRAHVSHGSIGSGSAAGGCSWPSSPRHGHLARQGGGLEDCE